MDFFDSIDINAKEKKSRRVRSWYLYEQYKALERNQLDAARELKDRTYQERILRRELRERRARRKLYDQIALCQSESCIDKNTSDGNKTSLSISTDDFFESFCELQDDEKSTHGTYRDVTDTEDTYSQDDSQAEKHYLDDCKSVENIKEDQSFTSVNSVVQNYNSDKTISENLKEEIKLVKKNIAEEINVQFDAVKENIQCLEKYSILCSEDKITKLDNTASFEEDCLKAPLPHSSQESDINIYNIWSKVVSFAYQVMQLNHGNCYYDYSSQFLTAVLACDVLRRGVHRMCHILQPYVSPINYTTDESDTSINSHKNIKRKKASGTKISQKRIPNKIVSYGHNNNKTRIHSKHVANDYWRKISKHSSGYKSETEHRFTDPSGSMAIFSPSEHEIELGDKSSCSLPPLLATTFCQCPCHVKVSNPMLKIGKIIDRALENIDDCKQV